MSDKIGWVDNLRALACLMVVLIHSTSYYITTPGMPGELHWAVANLLNSASRAGVPLFFMISGYLFFGERQAEKRHFMRLGCCLVFYSAAALLYMALFTPLHIGHALRQFAHKPVFYHLWFFYALAVIYLFSPLIRVSPVSGRYLTIAILILAVVANPNMPDVAFGQEPMLPVNLYISGDTFYYLLYAVVGRALGVLTLPRWMSLVSVPVFMAAVILIALGTWQQTMENDGFSQTFYLYANPLVCVAAVSLMAVFKTPRYAAPLPGATFISRHSLAIYGFHALIIHFIRTHDLALSAWPVVDIFYVFLCALLCSVLFSRAVQQIDTRRWVS